MREIILDCDPGHDDAIALLLALASPELELLGVTTVAGNQTLDKTTANAIRVLDHVGHHELPVHAGASRPLVREWRAAVEVHGDSGLDGPQLPPPSRPAGDRHAVDWIAETVLSRPHPPTLVAIGPLTNVALLLARYPEAGPQLAGIVLMGGSIAEGNVTPAAEFNIWADPEAAARVFASGIQLTMVGLDVTHRALMTARHAARLAQAGSAGRLVSDLFGFYSRFHADRYGWDGVPVHDAVAVAHVVDDSLLVTERCAVLVDTGAEPSRGRTYVDRWRATDWAANCEVAIGIDSERFLELLVTRIEALG